MNEFNLITFIASVLLVIEVYLSLIVICSSKETAFFKIRPGRLSVSQYKQRPRTNIGPVGGYYTNIDVYRKAQLR